MFKSILKTSVVATFALAFAACTVNAPTARGSLSVGVPVTGTINGSVGFTTVPGRSSSIDVPAETWTVGLTAGQTVTLLMCRTSGASFDPYLSIHGPAGREDNVRINDDGAGFPNARLVYTPTSSGTHTIYATTFSYSESRTGSYQLTVFAGDMSTVRCP